MTRGYLWREDSGTMVFDALANNPDGLTKAELGTETGLSPTQVGYGLTYIRELLAGLHGEPIICDYRTWKYKLAADRNEVRRYLQSRLGVMHTQIQNLLTGTADPAVQKFGGQRIRRVRIDLQRADEDMTELLEMVDMGASG